MPEPGLHIRRELPVRVGVKWDISGRWQTNITLAEMPFETLRPPKPLSN